MCRLAFIVLRLPKSLHNLRGQEDARLLVASCRAITQHALKASTLGCVGMQVCIKERHSHFMSYVNDCRLERTHLTQA